VADLWRYKNPEFIVNGSEALPEGALELGIEGGRIGLELGAGGAYNISVSERCGARENIIPG